MHCTNGLCVLLTVHSLVSVFFCFCRPPCRLACFFNSRHLIELSLAWCSVSGWNGCLLMLKRLPWFSVCNVLIVFHLVRTHLEIGGIGGVVYRCHDVPQLKPIQLHAKGVHHLQNNTEQIQNLNEIFESTIVNIALLSASCDIFKSFECNKKKTQTKLLRWKIQYSA